MRYAMAIRVAVLGFALCLSVACHHGRLMNAGDKQAVGGTIAGSVTTTDRNVPLAGRKVTAVDTDNGMRFDATTGVNGGYTIQVPRGRYRLEVELREGETIAKRPAATRITNSDLDARRDFEVTVKR